MQILLAFSRAVDWLNERVGRLVYWLVLAAVVVSAGNAIIRYSLDTSSNKWLELQWYFFSAIFLLCAGYTMLRNEHIRIDIIAGRLSERAQTWIDIIGGVLFLLPMSSIIMWLSWPVFMDSYIHHEVSQNAGGLVRWPVKILMPIGFGLLMLQALSETIKRIAFLMGLIPNPNPKRAGHGAAHADPIDAPSDMVGE